MKRRKLLSIIWGVMGIVTVSFVVINSGNVFDVRSVEVSSTVDFESLETYLQIINDEGWNQTAVNNANAILATPGVNSSVWEDFFSMFFSKHPFNNNLSKYLGYPIFHWFSNEVHFNLQQGIVDPLINTIRNITSENVENLSGALCNPILLQTLMNSHKFLDYVVNIDIGMVNETTKNKIYEFYSNYIENYSQYFKKNILFDVDAEPYIATLRAQVYLNLRDALNLTPLIKSEIAETINLTGQYLNIWTNFSILILDNNGFDENQLNVIYNFLSKVPSSLHNLGHISQNEFLGNTGSRKIWLAGKNYGGINIFGVAVGASKENQFPDDVEPRYNDLFSSCLAHETNHIVDAYYIEENNSLKNRKVDLLNAAGNDHMNYLRSMCEDGFFQQAPQEFFASIANEYFSSSAHTLDVGIVRHQNGYTEPLKQFLFFADVYSLGRNYTKFYTIDEEGNIEVRNIGLERDNNGGIKYLSIVNLTLNGEDNSIEINPGESVNITASLETNQEIKYLEIYKDGELLISGNAPLAYILACNESGIHNITAIYPINGSYFISYETHLSLVGNVPPVANFNYFPENPTTADIIQFTDLSSDSDGSIVNWTWNFDDGNISYEQNPSHEYAYDRIYNVTLIVRDNDGATDSITKQVTIGIKGDSNGDGHVSWTDFLFFADAYNSQIGDPNYQAIFDFNDDGYVEWMDFLLFADVYEWWYE